MKITRIQTYLLRRQLSSSMKISRGGFSERTHAIVEVITDEGIKGLGEGVGTASLVKSILDGHMGELAIGLDPFNIEQVRRRLIDSQVYFEAKGSVICAASAIEMACWDIKGKALSVPTFELLGGCYRDKINSYASDIYWKENPSEMALDAERLVNMGFGTIKAHLGYESPEKDLNRIKAIRSAIGPGIRMMVDVNGGYDGLEAYQASQLWESEDLFWLEEPVNPNQVESLADLRNRVKVPIAAGENEFRVHGFKNLLNLRAIDVAMPDIGRVGGIQEAKNICALAEAYGIVVSPHNFSSGVLLAATIHLMASTPNTQLLELDMSSNAVYQEFLLEPLVINKGYVNVPKYPGLGIEMKPEILKKYVVSK